MKKLMLLAMLLIPGLALCQGDYPYVIGTDYRQGSYNGGKNTAAIEKMQNDLAAAEINYSAGGRKGVIVLDSGNWAITSSVTFLNYAEYIVPLGSTVTVYTNTILNLNGATFWAENFPIFLGSGIVTGCMNVAISHDDGQWGGQWTNGFSGSYYVTNCAGLIGGDDIAPDSITGAHIVDGTIDGDDIAPDSITGAHIVDGTINTNDLDPDALDYLRSASGTNETVIFRAYTSTNSVGPFAANTLTQISFDGGTTASFNYAGTGGWDTVTSVFTAPANGWYRFYAKLNARFVSSGGSGFQHSDDYILVMANSNATYILSQSQRIEAGNYYLKANFDEIQPLHYDEFYLAEGETVALFIYPDNAFTYLMPPLGVPANWHASMLSYFGGGLIALGDVNSTLSSTNLPGGVIVADTNVYANVEDGNFYATSTTSAAYSGGSSFQTVTGMTFAFDTTSSVLNTVNGAVTPPASTNLYTIHAFVQATGYGSTGNTNCNYTFRITKDDVPWRQVTYQNQNPDTTNSAYLTGVVDPTDGTDVYRMSVGYDDITSGAESFQVLNSSWWMKYGF